jgi:hypothetical protein
MIYNFKYSINWDRHEVLEYLKSKNFKRVIDIGATANGWSVEYITHYMDINAWNTDVIGFHGNICLYSTWKSVLEDVANNGKFDFAICSHTLEDISSPQFVSEMICEIANEGFVAVPSKNVELSRNVNGSYYGHVHHRWIYNKEDNKFVAYPKLNFIEHRDWSSIVSRHHGHNELCFFWKDDFKFNIVNNDYMGPSADAVYEYFGGLNNE